MYGRIFQRLARLCRSHGRLILCTGVLSISGCTLSLESHRLLSESSPVLSRHALVAHVPFYPQEHYQCGPAALAMVLSWGGAPVTPQEIVSEVLSAQAKGSFQSDLIASARRRGGLAYLIDPRMEVLLKEIEAGNPVLVLLNLGLSWLPVWHYAVALGYDLERATIRMHSGRQEHEEVPLLTFERMWNRGNSWGVLVLPAGALPARVVKRQYLQSAIGLERAKQWSAAMLAYRAATRQWPDDLIPQLGLAHALRQTGALAEARQILFHASQDHPASDAVLNNYAHVLAEQGLWEEALQTARRAVALHGPNYTVCVHTLQCIQQRLAATNVGQSQQRYVTFDACE